MSQFLGDPKKACSYNTAGKVVFFYLFNDAEGDLAPDASLFQMQMDVNQDSYLNEVGLSSCLSIITDILTKSLSP